MPPEIRFRDAPSARRVRIDRCGGSERHDASDGIQSQKEAGRTSPPWLANLASAPVVVPAVSTLDYVRRAYTAGDV